MDVSHPSFICCAAPGDAPLHQITMHHSARMCRSFKDIIEPQLPVPLIGHLFESHEDSRPCHLEHSHTAFFCCWLMRLAPSTQTMRVTFIRWLDCILRPRWVLIQIHIFWIQYLKGMCRKWTSTITNKQNVFCLWIDQQISNCKKEITQSI